MEKETMKKIVHIVMGNVEQSTRHILHSFSLLSCIAVSLVQKL